MAITPQTDLKLLIVPIEIDNKNQLKFNDLTSQLNYFNSLTHIDIYDITYQRKDNIIRYPDHIDNIINFNYVMYKNENYSDKWFFAFIEDMEYINDNMTNIKIKTDVYQTWQFDLNFKNSFVEREHVINDIIGLHTVPEQLETGEYINQEEQKSSNHTCHAVACLTYDIANTEETNYPYQEIQGVPTGLHYFLIGDFTSVNGIGFITSELAKTGKLEALNSIFLVPDNLSGYKSSGSDFWDYFIPGNFQYAPYHKLTDVAKDKTMETININKPTSIDGYTPKNNKLFTYPYCYLNVDNNGGNSYNYMYEYFNGNPSFNIKGAITPGCSVRLIPSNYKNVNNNNSEGVNGAKYPICSWAGDVYTNWLTQNAVNIGVSIASSSLQVAGGVGLMATGAGATAGAGSITSGALGIASTIGEIYQHSLTPPQVEGNTNSGDVTYSTNNLRFTFYKKCIKAEFARIIDNFFSMYGYKINRVKTPELHSRRNWNYIKTIDCNITGGIPQNDMNEIKNLFNTGITLWHNPKTFLDYSQNNGII